jgi:hypothetical protein
MARERHDRSLTDKVQNCRAFRENAGNETVFLNFPGRQRKTRRECKCKKKQNKRKQHIYKDRFRIVFEYRYFSEYNFNKFTVGEKVCWL